MRDPSAPAAVEVEVEPSGASRGRTARLVLELGPPTLRPARSPAIWPTACSARSETLLADRTTDLPARLRDALIGLADALSEQTDGGATVIGLDTPLTRAWRAHPAGRGR